MAGDRDTSNGWELPLSGNLDIGQSKDLETVIDFCRVARGAINTSGAGVSAVNNGTANTGVTAVEYGNGYDHTTVLTVSQVDALTVADNAALCDGYLLYTFPAGEIIVKEAYISMAVTLAEDTTATPEVGLGTLEGSDAQATLGADDAACENILGPATANDCNGTAEVLTAAVGGGTPLVIATADDHTVYFNVADTWADTAGTDLTGDIAGTVVLKWSYMA